MAAHGLELIAISYAILASSLAVAPSSTGRYSTRGLHDYAVATAIGNFFCIFVVSNLECRLRVLLVCSCGGLLSPLQVGFNGEQDMGCAILGSSSLNCKLDR